MRQMFFDLTSRARFVLGVLPGVFAILMLTAGCEPASETEVASSGQSAVSDETTLNNGATEGSQNEAADNRAGQSGESRGANRNHT